MTDSSESRGSSAAGMATGADVPASEKEKLRRTFDEMREQVAEVLDRAREDASKTWKEDKAVLKEKLVDIDKVKADLEEQIDRGYVRAQETWAQDREGILEKVEEIKSSLKVLSEKGLARAQETWALDKDDIHEKVDDVKKALKGGWEAVTEKTAGLINKLLQ